MVISFQQLIQFFADSKIDYFILNENSLIENYELASLNKNIPTGLYYLEREYISNAERIRNSLIITNAAQDSLMQDDNVYLIVANPQLCFYKICRWIAPKKKTGIHPTAIVDACAQIGEYCYIGPYAVIGDSIIEDNCYIDAHVIISDKVIIKNHTRIEPNSYIGANGVAWIWGEDGKRVVQPQFGGVIIEENCFIGSDVSIVRGSVNEDTLIGSGTLIAHGSKIGHGSQLGENCHLANNVSLAGNSKIGNRTFLGSASVLSSHVSIAEDCVVGAGAVVTKSFSESGIILAGIPAKILNHVASMQKLNGIPKTIKK